MGNFKLNSGLIILFSVMAGIIGVVFIMREIYLIWERKNRGGALAVALSGVGRVLQIIAYWWWILVVMVFIYVVALPWIL